MLSTSHFPAQSRVQNLVVGLQKIGLVMRHHQGTETGPGKVNPFEMQTLQLLSARHDQTVPISTIATELGVTDDTALMVVRQLASKGPAISKTTRWLVMRNCILANPSFISE